MKYLSRRFFRGRELAAPFLGIVGWGAMGAMGAAASDCNQAEFPVVARIQVNPSVYDVAVADVDGDGNQDVAILAAESGLSISLGDGRGGFKPAAAPRPAGTFPNALALQDFNGDGRPDAAVSDLTNLSVLLNDGSGSFLAPVTYKTGGTPHGIAVADFNGDGRLDLVVANSGNNNFSVLLGDGIGKFGAPIISSVGVPCFDVVAGDFNGDGALDVAIAAIATPSLLIFEGDNTGHFTAGPTYSVGGNSNRVVAADFNGDGELDLVVNFQNGPAGPQIFLGNGDGSFTPGDHIPAVDDQDLVAADLNGDGNVDLGIVTGAFNTVEVALGDGTGHFAPAHPNILHGGAVPNSLAVGNLDGQGNLDLVTGDFGFAKAGASLLYNVPVVALRAAANASEGGMVGRFLVTRKGCNASPLNVRYRVSGTADPGVDYVALSGAVTIPAGQDSTSIAVEPIDDSLVEGPETIVLTLEARTNYGVERRNHATVTLEDND